MRYTQSLILVGVLILSQHNDVYSFSKKKNTTQAISEDDFFDFDMLDAQLENAGMPTTFTPEKDPSTAEVALRRVGMPIFLALIRMFSGLRSLLAFLYALLTYPFRGA